MNVTLLLPDAHNNAVQILRLGLHILLGSGDQYLTSLADVARLIFIGDAQRDDVQLGEVLREGFGTAHVQHLEESLLRRVDAVLRASLSLCQPDRRFT